MALDDAWSLIGMNKLSWDSSSNVIDNIHKKKFKDKTLKYISKDTMI
jgi:hypothetical protein